MICKKCHEICKYLGAAVGGTKLYGCPKCGRVYYDPKEN